MITTGLSLTFDIVAHVDVSADVVEHTGHLPVQVEMDRFKLQGETMLMYRVGPL